MSIYSRVGIVAVGLILGAAALASTAQAGPTPPGQPDTGPGGKAYVYSQVAATSARSGKQPYWIFEPVDATGALPVLVFLHGEGANTPDAYQAWIQHLVLRGAIVVYPRFEAGLTDAPEAMTEAAARCVRDALEQLDGRRHAQADLQHVALVGHSTGATVAANLAAHPPEGFPKIRALMAVDPADVTPGPGTAAGGTLVGEYTTIPPDVLTVVVVDADAKPPAPSLAKRLFTDLPQIRDEDKAYIVVHSDGHGAPALVADDVAPLAPLVRERARTAAQAGSADALDYFGYWKLFDGLTDAAFFSRNREFALGGGAAADNMGRWSDGQGVTPLTFGASQP